MIDAHRVPWQNFDYIKIVLNRTIDTYFSFQIMVVVKANFCLNFSFRYILNALQIILILQKTHIFRLLLSC